MVMVMVTVTPLQDPAGLVDDCPKLTNLHRYVDYEIENYAVNDDDDGDHDNVDDDDDDDIAMTTVMVMGTLFTFALILP